MWISRFRLHLLNTSSTAVLVLRNFGCRATPLSRVKMADSYEERLKRLEYRSRESDDALKQLSLCVDVLQQAAESKKAEATLSQESDLVSKLERENAELTREIERLKQELIVAELLNGRPQITNPSFIAAAVTEVVKTQEKASVAIAAEGNAGGGDESKPEEKVVTKPSKGKKEKPAAAEASGAGKGGGGGGEKPVDVSRLDMRVGKILSVKLHPDADTLYVEEIDVGEERPRTVCSGLVNFIPIEEMKDRLVIAMCNLKPAKMRGVLSEAMVMCASSPNKIEILDPPPGSVPGDRIIFEGYPGEPDAQLNPKKKIFEKVQPDLVTTDECVAVYKGVPFSIEGKGVCKSQTMKRSIIK